MKKSYILPTIALAVLIVAPFFSRPAKTIGISHWIAAGDRGAYVCQLYFKGRGAAITFASEDDFNAFVKLPGVKVVSTPAPVRLEKSEVVVSDKEATK